MDEEKQPKKIEVLVGVLACLFIVVAVKLAVSWRPHFDLNFNFALPKFSFASEEQKISPTPIVTTTAVEVEPVVLREKSTVKVVKGIYLTANSAASSKKMDEIIKLVDSTELNAVVLDIKDYTGNILYDSKIPLVNVLHTKRVVVKDYPAIIKKLHDHNIYVIARQTVFQDPVLAVAKPEWAIKAKSGGIWHDQKGLSWVDETRHEVWDYNVAIAREAADMGFDELNFDYVRFPTDGNMKNAVMPSSSARNEVMKNFYHYLSDKLKDKPVYLSLDFFGLIMEVHNGMDIGQRIESASDVIDYISPMMYPSHYAKGQMGFANPADHPGEIVNNGMKKGGPTFVDKRAVVRPWLQAFNLGAVYDATKIRAQIDAVEKYPNAGWLLWNAANRYTSAGLKSR